MPFLVAAIALVGSVCVVNLVLTYGVIRRLRQHAELLSSRRSGMALTSDEVAEFATVTADGKEVDQTRVAQYSLIGLFSAGCAPCAQLLPKFVARAANGGASERMLAVVLPGDWAADDIERLAAAATVVSGEDAKVVATAFGVQGYPVLCRVSPSGRIIPAEIDGLPALAAA
jgi:hypothetical protein